MNRTGGGLNLIITCTIFHLHYT